LIYLLYDTRYRLILGVRMMKSIAYRSLVNILLCFLLALPVGFASSGVQDITLTWAEDAKTSQTITWRTDSENSMLCVEYSEADAPDIELSAAKTKQAETSLFATDEGNVYMHTVTLRNLKPGTRYVYRIGDGQNWVADGMFRTEKLTSDFKFLLFGDSQSYDYTVWKTTFMNAYQQNRDVDFFVNIGDLVDNGQKYQEWRNWFDGIASVSNRLPVVPVVGNHETYTPEHNFSMPVFFTQQFMMPQNGPNDLKGQVYSFDYGDVHFVILDSQFGEERKFLPDSLERQKTWLANDLAATNKLWKVVFMHKPPYHNRIAQEQPDVTESFVPIFDQYGVDVVFSGHDHVNARTFAMVGGERVKEAGTIYSTVGRSGTKYYDTVGAKSWDEQFANVTDMPTYSVVKVTKGLLYIQVFKQNGELLDEWSLLKMHK